MKDYRKMKAFIQSYLPIYDNLPDDDTIFRYTYKIRDRDLTVFKHSIIFHLISVPQELLPQIAENTIQCFRCLKFIMATIFIIPE